MPGDLNLKKSWHPGLIKNQQKLWQQEQDALQEHQKIKERQKEIELEREKQDLIRLQYGENLENVPSEKKLEINKLSWMYDEGPKKNASGFNELSGEFLEGKKEVEEMLSGKQSISKVAKSKDNSRLDKVIFGASRGKGGNGGAGGEAIDLGKDDPLLKIRGQMSRVASQRTAGDREVSKRDGDRNRDRSPSRRKDDSSRSSRSRDGDSDRVSSHSSRSSSHRSSHSSHHRSSHRSSSDGSSHRSSHQRSSHRTSHRSDRSDSRSRKHSSEPSGSKNGTVTPSASSSSSAIAATSTIDY